MAKETDDMIKRYCLAPDTLMGIAEYPDGNYVRASDYDAIAAELAMLSDKACAAVVAYRAALGKLTDGFKYPTEVVTIARTALAHSTEFAQREVAK